jgi:hypothetical protein
MDPVTTASIFGLTLISVVLFIMCEYYYRKYKTTQKKFDDLTIKRKDGDIRPLSEHERWLQIRSAILNRDDYRCQECGYYKHLEVHHIIPRRKGGTDEASNLITLCVRCHRKKHPENQRKRKDKIYRRKHKHRHRFNRNNCPVEVLKNVDESDFLEPRVASPERREALYRRWERNELKQT